MRAIPECLRGVFTTRRYTNPRLPLPYLHKFLDPYPEADDFQNFFLPSYSLVKKIHEDPISSFHVKMLTDRQKDKRRLQHLPLWRRK